MVANFVIVFGGTIVLSDTRTAVPGEKVLREEDPEPEHCTVEAYVYIQAAEEVPVSRRSMVLVTSLLGENQGFLPGIDELNLLIGPLDIPTRESLYCSYP